MNTNGNHPTRQQLEDLVKQFRLLAQTAHQFGNEQRQGNVPVAYWYGRSDSFGEAADLLAKLLDGNAEGQGE
jgi:hypothetical protein